ncbi:ER degradation-enhancing alpha-mannosidase-like protein 3 [Tribolium madens]|uniref:ER degradation-enhancing alpha-mannosidase-like protein 3 n=1 Tax=Tribolium madens TaxID=41895 RepID=UPI001CF724CD|nr:ER degradation-enhancing alpha-mannosidase-like protein 3 [Tribolium madens]
MSASEVLVRVFCVSVLVGFCAQCRPEENSPMTRAERHRLREETRDMFYHAYRAYMENAYPADELMPLSCKGRYRGLTPNRGDIDDCLGNFSLTLIDTLDSLVVLGDLEEFEHAVKLVIKDVSFDNDVVVSVFETNIRVLGGLLSAHILADYLQQRDGIMAWYKGELLNMAKDVGYRLLPAFNTTTGIPHSRVNMKYGLKSDRLESARETCTACAGSMILEMAALSRLTGEPIFEEKAHKAMDELWKMRHRSSDLMGTVLNVHSGDWVRRDSGVGAGIDSYYEYCLKAYILLGDNKYLHRFNRHYNAVMKYISQGPMLLDVHMHRPHTNSRNYMDALLAFWPGLQVLKGDLKPAVETHEMLYQVMQRHTFIPEAFTTDFQVHWGNHPLRPEFLESTYFLYGATNDPYYLEVGRTVLNSLQKYARVPCGYAAVNDVRTRKQEDRMDSFVLSETLKYLYLLFADKEDLILNLDEFIFTTEGHLLPLSLAGYNGNKTVTDLDVEEGEFARICPNTLQLFPETVRKPLQNMVDGMCPKRNTKRRLTATEFSASNINHLKMIKDMGINIIALSDGRVQLLHTFSSARSSADAEEGLLFMQEMMELSKLQTQQLDASPQSVTFTIKDQILTVQACPSQFGRNLQGEQKVTARTMIIHPFRACSDLVQTEVIKGKIAIMERGDCMFVDKARKVQKHGAVGAIIIDNTPGSSAATSPMFSMSGDGTDDVTIPTVFLFAQDASKLLFALSRDPSIEVTIGEYKNEGETWAHSEEESMFHKLKVSVQEFLNKHTGIAFSKSVKVGSFKASLGSDKIRITYEEGEEGKVSVGDTVTTPQWVQVRKDLLKSIMTSESKELYVPLNILRIYYQTLSDDPMEDKRVQDTVKQAEWLLNQLSIELANKDALIKPEENVKVLSVLTDFSQLAGKDDFSDLEDKETLKALNSILESVAKDVKFKKEHLGAVMKKLQEADDELVVSDVKPKDKDRDTSEINNSDSEHIQTKINHAVDEL